MYIHVHVHTYTCIFNFSFENLQFTQSFFPFQGGERFEKFIAFKEFHEGVGKGRYLSFRL